MKYTCKVIRPVVVGWIPDRNAIGVLSRLNISKFSLDMSFGNYRTQIEARCKAGIGRAVETQIPLLQW